MKWFWTLATCIALLAMSGSAESGCVGSSAFSTCFDESGNSYTVNRMGSMTMMNGFNANTGSEWSQTSQSFGNMTIHNGMTNGNPWNMTQQHFGGTTTYSGMNSAGQPFSYTCTAFGCN